MTSAERVNAERDLPGTFGERLRTLRTARGLTQRDLAGEGLSSSYLSRLESGQRTPTPKVVEQLATRLGVSADSFAGLGSGARATGGSFLAGCARVVDHLLAGRIESALEVLDGMRGELRDPEAKWLCEYAAAACSGRLGRTKDVFERLSEAENLFRVVPTSARAVALTLQTAAARELGRTREAIDLGLHAVAEADALGSATDFPGEHAVLLRVRARTTLAAAYNAVGRFADALEASQQATALTAEWVVQRPGKDPVADELTVVSHWMLAVTLARQGKLEAAGGELGTALVPPIESIGTELWCRVRLAVVSLFLEFGVPSSEAPDLLLNEVSEVRYAAKGQLEAQVFTLRAELALRAGNIKAALDSAEAALQSGVLGTVDRIRTLMTVVKVSTDLGLEERRLSALDELLAHLDTADPEEVRPALLKEVAALSVRTLRNHHGRS